MRILVDTDILLDFALARHPFLEESEAILTWAEKNPGHASVAWHSLSNIAYLAPVRANDFLQGLLSFMEVPWVGTIEAARALKFPMHDLEDALQASAAMAFNASWIITRNLPHYRKSPVPALLPRVFIAKITTT